MKILKDSFEVSIKTLTDYHLEAFISCPYRFYNQFILSETKHPIHWRQVAQNAINKIVKDHYQLSNKEQNSLSLLKIVEQKWKTINVNLFESKIQYYTVLAKITDNLLKLLSSKEKVYPPVFLYQKIHTYFEELETSLSLTFEVGEWSDEGFIIKKYLLDCDEGLIKLYQYLSTVFSIKAFGVLPERIEMISLLDGKKHLFYPTEQEVPKGLKYLDLLKDKIKNPNGYIKNNLFSKCVKCPINKQCNLEVFEDNETILNILN